MNNRIQYLIALFTSTIILSSCVKEDMPEGFFSTHSYYYLKTETSVVRFCSDTLLSDDTSIDAPSYVSWEITGIPEWLTVSPVRGEGSVIINITALENLDEEARECWLFVQSTTKGFEHLSDYIEVKQSYIVRLEEDDIAAGDVIDLGLPSGIKWAARNVDAARPWDCGGYYAWGETEEKNEYYWYDNYKWSHGDAYPYTYSKYCTDSIYGIVDNKRILDPEDDVAHVKWGGNWRMPNLEDLQELIDECTWEWGLLNGVYGYKVTGPSGNTIFLPATIRDGYLASSYGWGEYWSRNIDRYDNNSAYLLSFHCSYGWYYSCIASYRFTGGSVRPVFDE